MTIFATPSVCHAVSKNLPLHQHQHSAKPIQHITGAANLRHIYLLLAALPVTPGASGLLAWSSDGGVFGGVNGGWRLNSSGNSDSSCIVRSGVDGSWLHHGRVDGGGFVCSGVDG